MTDFEECWNIFYEVFERHEDEVFLNAWISLNPALNPLASQMPEGAAINEQLKLPVNLSFVIEIDGEIRAFLLTRETHVEFIGVKKSHQGKGLGTILLHNLLDKCKRECISVSLVPSNSDPKLIQWYEKHGFRVTGEYTENNEIIMIFEETQYLKLTVCSPQILTIVSI